MLSKRNNSISNKRSATKCESYDNYNHGNVHQSYQPQQRQYYNNNNRYQTYDNNIHEQQQSQTEIQSKEYQALQDFKRIANSIHWEPHLILISKIKSWSQLKEIHLIIQRYAEYNVLHELVSSSKSSFSCKETGLNRKYNKIFYYGMRQLTNKYHKEYTESYAQSINSAFQAKNKEIQTIIQGFQQQTDKEKNSYNAFIRYHMLREKRLDFEISQSIYFTQV
ncbi:hypothetical protein I4U23_005692 [Adineta vaga]|nr:hypothetical protein I4U23_005692 [Adineta vaga]